MKLLPLLLLSSPAFAQTCLTSIEVRKVNDLLDSYEALQEDSATFAQWQDAYTQCEELRRQDSLQIVDSEKLLKKSNKRSEELESDNGKLQKKVKRTGGLFWVVVGIAVSELGYIGIDAATSK